jgi:hypothetical protein
MAAASIGAYLSLASSWRCHQTSRPVGRILGTLAVKVSLKHHTTEILILVSITINEAASTLDCASELT